jgi:hypothetical protein
MKRKIGGLVTVLHPKIIIKKCPRPVGYVMLSWLMMASVVIVRLLQFSPDVVLYM